MNFGAFGENREVILKYKRIKFLQLTLGEEAEYKISVRKSPDFNCGLLVDAWHGASKLFDVILVRLLIFSG